MGLVAMGMATQLESGTLGMSLDGIQREARVLNVLAGAGSESQVGVEGSVPTSEETALDLGILGKTSLTNTLAGKRILLQGGCEGVLSGASVVLVEELAASQTGTSDSMAECLRLRLGGGRGDEGSLGFGGRGSRREEANLFADGAAKILESLLDVGGVVVGLVRVLGAIKSMLDHQHPWHVMTQTDYPVDLRHSKHLLVGLLEGIDALLEIDVVRRELGL